jgi:hypothetical protein
MHSYGCSVLPGQLSQSTSIRRWSPFLYTLGIVVVSIHLSYAAKADLIPNDGHRNNSERHMASQSCCVCCRAYGPTSHYHCHPCMSSKQDNLEACDTNKKKIPITLILLLGFLTVIATIFGGLYRLAALTGIDSSLNWARVELAASIEIAVGVICLSFPVWSLV